MPGEPIRIDIAIPSYLAEDLILAKPSLRSEVYVVILKGTFGLISGTLKINKLFA